jgi:hypothetical protein
LIDLSGLYYANTGIIPGTVQNDASPASPELEVNGGQSNSEEQVTPKEEDYETYVARQKEVFSANDSHSSPLTSFGFDDPIRGKDVGIVRKEGVTNTDTTTTASDDGNGMPK